MRAARAEPVEHVLRAGRRVTRGSATDAAHRRAVHGLSVLRQSAYGQMVDSAGGAGQPQAGATTDAAQGAGGHLSQATVEPGGARASDLPVPAAGRDDRA